MSDILETAFGVKPQSEPDYDTLNAMRLQGWEYDCKQNGQIATLLIAIGHGNQQGKVSVKAPEGLSKQHVKAMLQGVIQALDKGFIKIN